MTTNPTVAILIATYNGEQFLKQQLDSIFAQTYKNFKIYIADDRSSDLTVSIISSYQKNHPKKVFYSANRENIGFVKNFENLLTNCTFDYIAICDQDDIWLEEKLEVEMREMIELESLDANRAYLIHSDLFMMDENGNITRESYFKYRNYRLKSKNDLGHILGPCGVMGNTIVMNKKLRDLVLPFPDRLDLHDYWIAVNCELFGSRKTIFAPLIKYRIHSDNSSNAKGRLVQHKKFRFTRDIKLPYLQTQRKYYLPTLRDKIEDRDDLKVLDTFIDYLMFKKNRVSLFVDLLKYSLVKRDIYFRIKLFFKIIFTKRYR